MTPELRPVRPRSGGETHATVDYMRTLCARSCNGWLVAETVPTCKACIRVLANGATKGRR